MKMKSIGVAGGRLQGVEACYLAKKAGFFVTLIDRDRGCAAAGLADRFICKDILTELTEDDLCGCELIIPAIENDAVLKKLRALSRCCHVAFAHDEVAYAVSSSKLVSDRLFAENAIPAPRYYPEAAFPLIAKPSGESGSSGVRKLHTPEDLAKLHDREKFVIQEYLDGDSYSIEVIGDGERFYPLQITKIITDDAYDCRRVEAGVTLAPAEQAQMYALGEALGKLLKIRGIFDVETILSGGRMYVLEIDARLPSQTPTAVYHSTGLNMAELLYDTFCGTLKKPVLSTEKAVIYQHIHVKDGAVISKGEHIMGGCGVLRLENDFFGCGIEALTSRSPGRTEWVATLIIPDDNGLESAEKRLTALLEKIKNPEEHKMCERILSVPTASLYERAEPYMSGICGFERNASAAKTKAQAFSIRGQFFDSTTTDFLLYELTHTQIMADRFAVNGVEIQCDALCALDPARILCGAAFLFHAPMPDLSALALSKAYLADAWQTALVEAGHEALGTLLQAEASARFGFGCAVSRLFAPGHCAIASECVPTFFQFMNADKIGMKLLPSGLMSPVKSFVGIYVILRAENETGAEQ
ncbi:MAG: 3-methylornithine--L-lysine ligase PylC [Oscillospiraceae bacterium]